MPRNVGSVEVVVDANTGKLRAQIVPAAAKAGRQGAEALSKTLSDIDTAGALEEVHKLSLQIERDLESIDPDLSVDTTKVKQELDRLKARVAAELLEFDTEIDFTEVNASIAAFREEQEGNTIDLSFGVDLQNINRRIEVMRRELEANEITLNLGADLKSINASIDAFRRKQESDAVDINFGTDVAKINSRLAIWRREIEANQINLRLDVDLTTLNARIAAWRREVEAPRVNINFNADLARITARLYAFRAKQQQNAVQVPVSPNINQAQWAGARAQLNAWAKGTGNSSGQSFMGGLTHSLQDGGQIAVAAILSMGPGIAQGLEGLMSAGTAVIGSAFSAIAGGGAAAAAIVGAFGAAAGAAIVGTRGFSDALGAINTEFATARTEGRNAKIFTGDVVGALDKLAPSARNTALAFAAINDALHDSQQAVQNALFKDLDGVVRNFGEKTLPNVSAALEIAAGSVNEFIKKLAKVGENTDFVGTMEALKPALDNALDAAVLFVDSISPFLKTAGGTNGPAARLAGFIEDMAGDWNEFVRANPAKVTSFLDEGVDSLEIWIDLIGSVGTTMGTVFGSGKGAGDLFVGQLDVLIEKFGTFLKSPKGQTSLADFFNSGQQAITDLGPVVDGLKEAWDILTGADGGTSFATVMEDIGTALPGVSKILVQISDLRLGTGIATTIDVFGKLSTLFELLPDDAQQFIGTMIVVTRLTGPLNNAIRATATALGATSKAFAIIAGVNLAIGAGLFLWEKLSDNTDSAAERTDAYTASLEGALHNIVTTADETTAATAANDAWGEALANTGDESIELRDALGGVNQTMTDANEIVRAFQGNSADAAAEMEKLRGSTDLAGPAFDTLGTQLANLRTSGLSVGDIEDRLWETFHTAADAAHISRDEFDENVDSMITLQDTAKKVDMSDIAEQALRNASTLDDNTRATLETAASNLHMQGSIEDILDTGVGLVPLFDEYSALLAGVQAGTNGVVAETDAHTAGMIALSSAYTNAGIAAQERADALQTERDAAMQTWQAEQQLAETTRDIAATVATTEFGLPPGAARGFIDLGDAIGEASAKADALTSAMDTLFGAFPNQQEAISNAEEALDDMIEQLSGVETAADGSKTAVEGWTATLDLSTPAGRDNAAAVRESVAAMEDQAAASLAAGDSSDTVTAAYKAQREVIVGQVDALLQAQAASEGTSLSLDESRARAEAYVTALAGAPEAVSTLIEMPGLVDALLNADDLTVLYDSLGNPVVTQFEALGLELTDQQMRDLYELVLNLDAAEANPTVGVNDEASEPIEAVTGDVLTLGETTADPTLQVSTQAAMVVLLAIVQTLLTNINNTVVDPTLKLTAYPLMTTMLATLKTNLTTIDSMIIDPKITLPNYFTTKSQIETLDRLLGNLPDPNVVISLPGIHQRIGEVDQLRVAINNLQNRSITVTTNNVSTGAAPGSMAGELIGSPGLRRVGEFGLSEAIVPLELPLSRVDPSVRWMAELLRGGPAATGGGGMTVNQTIVTQTEDTVSVAAQVVNRMSASVAGL